MKIYMKIILNILVVLIYACEGILIYSLTENFNWDTFYLALMIFVTLPIITIGLIISNKEE